MLDALRQAFLSRKTASASAMKTAKEHTESLPFMNRVDAALLRRPRHAPLVLSMATGASLLLFILWAGVATLDEVAHGQGQVISSQRTQVIENLEGGIVREILVTEGQIVEKKQLLMRLDNEMAESAFRDAENKTRENKLVIIRLEAELQGVEPQFPEDLTAEAPLVVEDQRKIYAANSAQHRADLAMLDLQHQQRLHEIDDLLAKQQELNESLVLAQKRLDIAKPLYDRQNFSQMDYIELQQKVVTLRSGIESMAATISKARDAAAEAAQKTTLRKAELDGAITAEINKRRSELASFEQTLAAGSDRVVRKEIRSPVRGTVKQIMVTTIGGVVKPGQTIMELVPLDDSLMIEARIRPADIAFISPRQKATIKITAYDSSIYGSLQGVVEHISADTIEDRRGERFYNVLLRTPSNSLLYREKALPIIPGMVTTVDILTGKKTVLDYLLKPILKSQQNALHER